MLGTVYTSIKNALSGGEKKSYRDNEISQVFQSYSPYGNYPAPWQDNPHEQIRHYRHWVYAAVKAIASKISGTPLNFFRNDTGEKIPAAHPINMLMRAVNPFETSVSLWMKTAMYLELTGNAYWYVPKNIFGTITEIWVIPSQYMKVIPDMKNFISGYAFSNGTVEESFSKDDIIHLKYPSPHSVFYGKSPLQAAASSVDAHEAMKESERRSFENGVFPGVAIKTSEKLSKDVRERLEATVRRGFSGPERAGKAIILEQGLSMQPFTFSPREMDFMQSSKITRDEILAVFGVPAAVAGISEDVNRASAEAMLYTFAQNTIIPKLRLLEAQLTQDLCITFDNRIEAKFEDPTPAVRSEDRADMVARIKNGITTPVEERLRLGLKLPQQAIAPVYEEENEEEKIIEKINSSLKSIFAGQLKRIERISCEKNISIADAIHDLVNDPLEKNRIEAPMAGLFAKVAANSNAKSYCPIITARSLNALKVKTNHFIKNNQNLSSEKLRDLYENEIIKQAVCDTLKVLL